MFGKKPQKIGNEERREWIDSESLNIMSKTVIMIFIACIINSALVIYHQKVLMSFKPFGYVDFDKFNDAPKLKKVDEENNKAVADYADKIIKEADGKSPQELLVMRDNFTKVINSLEKKKAEERRQIISRAINAVAEERNLKVIAGSGVFVSDGDDVTAAVLEKLK